MHAPKCRRVAVPVAVGVVVRGRVPARTELTILDLLDLRRLVDIRKSVEQQLAHLLHDGDLGGEQQMLIVVDALRVAPRVVARRGGKVALRPGAVAQRHVVPRVQQRDEVDQRALVLVVHAVRVVPLFELVAQVHRVVVRAVSAAHAQRLLQDLTERAQHRALATSGDSLAHRRRLVVHVRHHRCCVVASGRS